MNPGDVLGFIPVHTIYTELNIKPSSLSQRTCKYEYHLTETKHYLDTIPALSAIFLFFL